ncbi:PAS domain S-box protein [Pseudodesulfovibrio senegalensis]|nr:PAS domain S-box protein [Pseudodesulfovibrio senegalensis]
MSIRSTMVRQLLLAIFLLFAVQPAAASKAQTSASRPMIMVLVSYSPVFPTFPDQMKGLKASMKGSNIRLVVESMDSKRLYDATRHEAIRSSLEYKMAKLGKPDVLVTTDDNALSFALAHRNSLFADIPIVFLGVNDPALAEKARRLGNATGILEKTSERATIAMARQLFPEARTIAVIYDGTPSGKADFRNILPATRLFPWLRFERLNLARITYAEMAAGLRALPQNSLILLLSAYRDRDGNALTFSEILSLLRESSHCPILHLWKHGIGSGLFGGKVVDHFNQAKLAGTTARAILAGTPADTIPVVAGEDANTFIFDYNQIVQYGIAQNSLPKNSTILNLPPPRPEAESSPLQAVALFTFIVIGGMLILHLLRSRAVTRRQKAYCREQLSTILENATIGIVIMDNLGNVHSANPELCRMTGHSKDVLATMSVVDLFVLEERADFMEVFENLVKGRQFCKRLRLLRNDGTMLHAEMQAVNFRQGIYVGFFCDVTRIMDAEEMLAESEARFRALNEQAEDAMFIHDFSGHYLLVNRKACEILGYTKEELMDKTVWDIDPQTPINAPKTLWADTPRKLDTMLMRKDGTEVPVEVQLSRITFEGRDVIHALARDISDRNIAEQRAMRESMVNLAQAEIARELTAPDSSTESLAAVVRQHAMMITGSAHGLVSSVDEASRENVPHTFTEMMEDGQCRMDVAHVRMPWHGGKYDSLLGVALNEHKAFFTNDPANHEQASGLPSGHVPLEQFISAPAMFEEKLVGQIALANPGRDYTDEDLRVVTALADLFALAVQRQQAEAALVRAKDAAEAASKAKGEFLANVSHEIRTPLNGVFGMLQLMDATKLDPEQADYLHTAMTSGQNLLRVINDVLDFSKIEAGKIELQEEPFSLRELIKSIHAIFSVQAQEKGIDFRWDVDPEAHDNLIGDAGRIRQILFNLVGNAIKFTNEGEIVIEADTLGQQDKPGNCSLFISVSDTGIGIPEQKLDLIFRAFEQVDGSYSRKYPGTGLGLGIVRRFVELMGGQVRVKSTVGMGSTFSLSIYVKTGLDDSLEDETPENTAELPKLSLLLAEDDRVNRITAQRLLEKMGHSVVWAQNGLEALNKLSEQHFDCVLMDIQMPQMDGMQAVAEIRASDDPAMAAKPVIALTAHAMKGDKEQFLKGGMDDYVSKPVNKEELEAVLRRVLLKGGSFRGLD